MQQLQPEQQVQQAQQVQQVQPEEQGAQPEVKRVRTREQKLAKAEV